MDFLPFVRQTFLLVAILRASSICSSRSMPVGPCCCIQGIQEPIRVHPSHISHPELVLTSWDCVTSRDKALEYQVAGNVPFEIQKNQVRHYWQHGIHRILFIDRSMVPNSSGIETEDFQGWASLGKPHTNILVGKVIYVNNPRLSQGGLPRRRQQAKL